LSEKSPLVSPANKDRAANRKAFAVKCASYLQQGAALIVIDIVTNRTGYFPQDTLDLLTQAASVALPKVDTLYGFACRTLISRGQAAALDVWCETLTLGKPLPTMPLWLAADCVIGVPFEDSYNETCKTLRIRAG
jgi:hypothetical protein